MTFNIGKKCVSNYYSPGGNDKYVKLANTWDKISMKEEDGKGTSNRHRTKRNLLSSLQMDRTNHGRSKTKDSRHEKHENIQRKTKTKLNFFLEGFAMRNSQNKVDRSNKTNNTKHETKQKKQQEERTYLQQPPQQKQCHQYALQELNENVVPLGVKMPNYYNSYPTATSPTSSAKQVNHCAVASTTHFFPFKKCVDRYQNRKHELQLQRERVYQLKQQLQNQYLQQKKEQKHEEEKNCSCETLQTTCTEYPSYSDEDSDLNISENNDLGARYDSFDTDYDDYSFRLVTTVPIDT